MEIGPCKADLVKIIRVSLIQSNCWPYKKRKLQHRETSGMYAQRKDYGKTQGESSHLHPKEKGSGEAQPVQTLILDL